MKKTIIFLLLIVGISANIFAQSEKEIINQKEVVWYGLDFSKAKLVGSAGFTDPVDIQRRMFDGWNQIVTSEAEKYNIKKAFNKENVIIDLTAVGKNNATVDPNELVINKDYAIDKEEVQKIVNSYKLDQKSGIGLVFIVESFNKLQEKGFIYVTFFDISTKKVLATDKYTGKPKGFGVKNYWAGSIYNIINDAEADYKNRLKKA